MPALPGGTFDAPRYRAVDTSGVPLNGAKLYFWETGGTFTTPKSVYTTSALSVALSNPVVSDSAGLFAQIFLNVDGYDVQLKSSDGATTYWSALNVTDIGQTYLANLGTQFTTGTLDVASGYTVLSTDWFVSTNAADATNPFILNLPALASRTNPVIIKHQTTNALRITPNGADQIETIAAYYAVAAAASPNFPTVWLAPQAASWRIIASHGL